MAFDMEANSIIRPPAGIPSVQQRAKTSAFASTLSFSCRQRNAKIAETDRWRAQWSYSDGHCARFHVDGRSMSAAWASDAWQASISAAFGAAEPPSRWAPGGHRRGIAVTQGASRWMGGRFTGLFLFPGGISYHFECEFASFEDADLLVQACVWCLCTSFCSSIRSQMRA